MEAAYDVAFGKYSLGIFTMLVEIRYCIEQGMAYYYPGFYPKGSSMFDYKLRPGQIEFFRPKEEKWLPWSVCRKEDWLLDEVFKRLKEVNMLLLGHGFKSSIKVFNITNFPSSVPTVSGYNFLVVGEYLVGESAISIKIAWDPFKGSFLMFNKENGKPVSYTHLTLPTIYSV